MIGCFDTALTPEQHLDNVRYGFFADGNDATVWRTGWHPAVARLQTQATQATPLDQWWGGGRAPMLVIQALQDTIALPENGRALKAEFGARVTLIDIDRAGHALLPEQPAAVSSAVLAFLRSH